MGEHLDPHKITGRTFDALVHDRLMDLHLQPDLPAICDRRHVRGDDCVHSRRLGSVQCLPHRSQIFPVKNDIQSHIGLDSIFPAYFHNPRQIVRREVVRRMRAHIQVANPEIDGVRPALYRGVQAFEIAGRRHYLKFLLVHCL